MELDARIMRISTKVKGAVAQKDMQALWDQTRYGLKSFNIEHALRSDLIILTNTDNDIVVVVSPTSISKVANNHRNHFVIDGYVLPNDLIGQKDPTINSSRNPIGYNWK